ncbi:MAG: ATP-binding protein [Deltaproteobacteria bacterium]|nr:ATP-binding protein [Deltaproteobacteria bacterium]
MRLPFLGREREIARLIRAFGSGEETLVVLVGRRRVGKSRLLTEALAGLPAVYVVGDEQDAPLHRAAVAREMAALVRGFDAVLYPTWDALLDRWWSAAPAGAVLALDEFQAFASASPELPSVLQRWIDRRASPARHVALCGSSQRMMSGLVLDASAPLYGRAREILRLGPLEVEYLPTALGASSPLATASAWATWGGIPRYWELAADFTDPWAAVADLVLDPSGVLHHEPRRLLLDDLRETARAASILALVGQGCGRMSEIARRLGQPATSLTRPLARLQDLGLLRREVPWGADPRSAKQSLYGIADPFLAFWYRFVDPARSRLAAGQVEGVLAEVRAHWPTFLGGAWEALARDAVARRALVGESWLPAGRWWGAGLDRKPLELDLVARHATDPGRVLVGEAKVHATPAEVPRLLADLADRAARCPALRGIATDLRLFVLDGVSAGTEGVVAGGEVVEMAE